MFCCGVCGEDVTSADCAESSSGLLQSVSLSLSQVSTFTRTCTAVNGMMRLEMFMDMFSMVMMEKTS